jgi:hypothetical protein
MGKRGDSPQANGGNGWGSCRGMEGRASSRPPALRARLLQSVAFQIARQHAQNAHKFRRKRLIATVYN